MVTRSPLVPIGRSIFPLLSRFILLSIALLSIALLSIALLSPGVLPSFEGSRGNALAENSPIHTDEEVILFPAIALPAPKNPLLLDISVHGWIFEPEHTSITRNLLLSSFCRSLKLLDEECDNDLFKDRARYFLVDNERRKRIPFFVANTQSISEPSGADGRFRGAIQIGLPAANKEDPAPLRVTSSSGKRTFQGEIVTVQPGGVTVISDIDDTIKVSQVTELDQLLRNTFLRPFRPTPGIIPLYQSLAKHGCIFHYVSASPWQLYPPLAEFLRETGLPGGTFHLKEFRWKDSRFFDLLLAPEKFKTDLILSRLAIASQRRFILVGDSGEKDPEIYGEIARSNPQYEIRILIREIAARPLDTERRKNAFSSLPDQLWRVVSEAELAQATEVLTRFALE